jgi:hypothetical protein
MTPAGAPWASARTRPSESLRLQSGLSRMRFGEPQKLNMIFEGPECRFGPKQVSNRHLRTRTRSVSHRRRAARTTKGQDRCSRPR